MQVASDDQDMKKLSGIISGAVHIRKIKKQGTINPCLFKETLSM
jgi:hypothetical protein